MKSRKEKRSYKHLDIEQRSVIEHNLDEGKSLSDIARKTGVNTSTIRREILRNRRFDGASNAKGKDPTDCVWLKSCKIKSLCEITYYCDKKLCKRCEWRRCHNVCKSYEKRVCTITEKAPFVCNSCSRYPRCTLERYRYSAHAAHEVATRRSHESRSGIDMTKEEMDTLVVTVREGREKGQSVHHIFQSNEMPCAERSFYRHVQDKDFPYAAIELPKAVKYKQRKHAKRESHESGFYKGHEYADYLELPEEDRAQTTEVDTVWGTKHDKKCILSLHRIDLHFQIFLLLAARTKEEVVKAFDWLEECSSGLFSEFFGLCLFDRGGEFDDIAGLERSIGGNGLRTAAYFADSSRPDQRGSAEKNHVELRKVLPKGTSLEAMDAYTLAEICSHVNSTIRKGCGDVTPMQMAQLIMPKELFDNLGLRLIPPQDVIAAPNILYRPYEGAVKPI